ncbi:MAG TPA: hypothetical protein VHU44_13745 [Acidobacteriaceae bacterium]|jgi:hypothetical protein|nr:hypothetical protein [Acidobacteriaceae bacterium]
MLRYLDMLILIAWYGFVVLGSAAVLVRISRGKRSYPGQAGGLPEKWRAGLWERNVSVKRGVEV